MSARSSKRHIPVEVVKPLAEVALPPTDQGTQQHDPAVSKKTKTSSKFEGVVSGVSAKEVDAASMAAQQVNHAQSGATPVLDMRNSVYVQLETAVDVYDALVSIKRLSDKRIYQQFWVRRKIGDKVKVNELGDLRGVFSRLSVLTRRGNRRIMVLSFLRPLFINPAEYAVCIYTGNAVVEIALGKGTEGPITL